MRAAERIVYNSELYYFLKNLQGDIVTITDHNAFVYAQNNLNNAVKTIEAYFHNQENIKKVPSRVLFIFDWFFASGISVFLLFDNWLAYVFGCNIIC